MSEAHSLPPTLGLIGSVIIVAALGSGLIQRSRMPQVGAFLALGAILGPYGLDVLSIGLDSPIFQVVATLSLTFVLFTDAVTLNLKEVKEHWRLALVVLGPGTLITALVLSLAAHLLLGLAWPLAIILGAGLASTDPVLLRGVLQRRDLPASARQALQLESGLNDIILLPMVLLAMTIGNLQGPELSKMLLRLFLLGPGAGVLVGFLAVAAMEMLRKKTGIRRDYESIYSIGVAMAAYAAGEMLHGSGFLAAFAAGLTINWMDVELCDCFVEYGETTTEVALLFCFVLLGASLIWTGLTVLSPAVLGFTVLALTVRTLVLLVSLQRVPRREKWLIAWFGPRGLSTLLLVLVPIFAHTPDAARLFPVAALAALASVLVHGGSMALLPAPPQVQADDRIELDELTGLEDAILLDSRTDRSYEESEQTLEGAHRVHPDRPVEEVRRLGLPQDARLVVFCTCPSEETSGRVTEALRRAGWTKTRALVGGWRALEKSDLPLRPK